jgi:hypothetical protein
MWGNPSLARASTTREIEMKFEIREIGNARQVQETANTTISQDAHVFLTLHQEFPKYALTLHVHASCPGPKRPPWLDRNQ